jgi:hypothetical protein
VPIDQGKAGAIVTDRRLKGASPKVPSEGVAAEDLLELRRACRHLEHPSLAARLSSVAGTPIEVGLNLLPRNWHKGLHRASDVAIIKALNTALSSMRREQEYRAHRGCYNALAAGSGAVSGLVGLPGLLLELPVTTTLMLRSIAQIARDQGEDIYSDETRTACLEVFALGGRTEMDDAADTGYYGVRLVLASHLTLATAQVSHPAIVGEGAPVMVQFIQAVAARFGNQLTMRAAARVLPVIGAAAGATVNLIFMQHFQDMAHGHFTVRRLERQYGADLIQANYENIARSRDWS